MHARLATGLASHVVEFPASTPADSVSATTSTDGSFRVLVDPTVFPLDRHSVVRVVDPGGEEVFAGSVAVSDNMVILVSPMTYLHGKVLPANGEALPTRVSISVAPAESWTGPGRLKWGTVDTDGTFGLRFRLAHSPPTATVRLTAPDDGLSQTVEVPFEDLASSQGAIIPMDTSTVTVQVVDDKGHSVPGARVRLWRSSTPDLVQLTTGPSGSVRFRVRPGEWNWSAVKEGSYPATGSTIATRATNDPVTAHLLEVRPGARLVGSVSSAATGLPVPQVIVSAWPSASLGRLDNPREFFTPFGIAKSDDRGRFSLAVPPDTELQLALFHRNYAHPPRMRIGPSTRQVHLRLGEAGQVLVHRRALVSQPAVSGRCLCLLVDRHRDNLIPRDGTPPIKISNVPPGDYNVFLACPDGGYGQTTATVVAGQKAEIEVETVPGSWFRGRVLTEAGAPIATATVQVNHPDWPQQVISWFGTVTTQADGRFRAFGGLAVRAPVTVRWPGHGVTRAVLEADTERQITWR